jgi:hypothetical protein
MFHEFTKSVILPHPCTFAAIGANVNILPALQYPASEIYIFTVMPDILERLALQITQPVLGIFIETTGNR